MNATESTSPTPAPAPLCDFAAARAACRASDKIRASAPGSVEYENARCEFELNTLAYWASLDPLARKFSTEDGNCPIPTLAHVDPWFRERNGTGHFIFFAGHFCGWSLDIDRSPASHRPGCVAIAADGSPGWQVAKGGDYLAGATHWEACK